jgi:hypothetical protein
MTGEPGIRGFRGSCPTGHSSDRASWQLFQVSLKGGGAPSLVIWVYTRGLADDAKVHKNALSTMQLFLTVLFTEGISALIIHFHTHECELAQCLQ